LIATENIRNLHWSFLLHITIIRKAGSVSKSKRISFWLFLFVIWKVSAIIKNKKEKVKGFL